MRSMVEGVRNESASLLACGLAEPCVQGRRCCVFLRLDGLFRLAMVFGEWLIPLTQVALDVVCREVGRVRSPGRTHDGQGALAFRIPEGIF